MQQYLNKQNVRQKLNKLNTFMFRKFSSNQNLVEFNTEFVCHSMNCPSRLFSLYLPISLRAPPPLLGDKTIAQIL